MVASKRRTIGTGKAQDDVAAIRGDEDSSAQLSQRKRRRRGEGRFLRRPWSPLQVAAAVAFLLLPSCYKYNADISPTWISLAVDASDPDPANNNPHDNMAETDVWVDRDHPT